MIISICAVCTLLAVCIMVGCEKPLMVNEETDVVKGNLTVTVFEIAKTPFESFTRGIEPASARCTRLNFAVYDEDGTRVKQVNQTSDASGFGTASFQYLGNVVNSPNLTQDEILTEETLDILIDLTDGQNTSHATPPSAPEQALPEHRSQMPALIPKSIF